MRSFVPIVRKSASRAIRSAVYAAAGTSIIAPIGTRRSSSSATPVSTATSNHATRLAQFLDGGDERKHDAERAVARCPQQRAELAAKRVRLQQAEAQTPHAAALLIEVERTDRHGTRRHALDHAAID